MKNFHSYIKFACLYACVALFFACQQPGLNRTGSEYMPDMAHSVAVEANYYNYYYHNTWGSQDEYYKLAQPRLPVAGTIPRGYAGAQGGTLTKETVAFAPNGSVPYYYGDSEDERNRAIAEIIDNPYPISTEGLARGKELYEVFCGICHGNKGDGLGHLARDGSPYPVAPANLLLPLFTEASNGRFYHAIMYGKNKMGAYKDKVGYEERWQVIHYIRSLQAKELKKEYNQTENTLNDVDRPGGENYGIAMDDHHGEHITDDHHETDDHEHEEGHGLQEDHGHGDDHGHDNSHH